jgi:RNA polymerase sigma-70 factor, ECF subfamily
VVAKSSERREPAPGTLGDLLYTDASATAPPEEDWVRLVQSIAARDQHALRALYERTHRLVFTLAMRINNSRESAEEVTLDVFHDVWRRSGEYDPDDGSVLGWIMNQARSRAIDRLRFEQRKKRVAPATDHVAEEPAAGPADDIDSGQRRRSLQGALQLLTPDERQAIESAFFGELTHAETAAHLDQPLGTVKTRVRSALAKMRRALENEGTDP